MGPVVDRHAQCLAKNLQNHGLVWIDGSTDDWRAIISSIIMAARRLASHSTPN